MKTSEHGFTRIDLVAVIAMIAVLAMMTLKTGATIARDVNGDLCLDHQRQLLRAVHLYTSDYADYLPPMWDAILSTPNSNWLNHHATSLPDATNSAKLINPVSSMLAPYLKGDPTAFKCPADTTAVPSAGGPKPRVRSVSMNHAVGTDPMSFQGKGATPGPWLDGSHGHQANSRWRCYARLADVVNPRPSNLYFFLDEGPASINDASYGHMGPTPNTSSYRWIDWPAAYHNGGAGFGFADGHGEIRMWASPATLNVPMGSTPPPSPASIPDIAWIAVRTSAPIADQP